MSSDRLAAGLARRDSVDKTRRASPAAKRIPRKDWLIHVVLIAIAGLTLLPFALVVNNSLRTNAEMDYSFFGVPHSLERMARFTWYQISGQKDRIALKVWDETIQGIRAADVV